MSLEQDVAQLRELVHIASGHTAATNLLIAGLMAQAHDKARLLRDFAEMSSDTEVRTMFSSMPEAFFEALTQSVSVWKEQIEEAAEDDARRR